MTDIYARFELSCRCVLEGPRCGHPFSDPKGSEEIPVPNQDRTIRISRCSLWSGHDVRKYQHRAVMPHGVGPLVRLTREGDAYAGMCHRCGEFYTAVLTVAGTMQQPEVVLAPRFEINAAKEEVENARD